MSKSKNGGAAFPSGSVGLSRPRHDPGASWVETDRVQPMHTGLSLRDYFAAKAMQGMLAHSTRYRPRAGAPVDWHAAIAEEAYDLASAMIAERDK